MVATPAATSTHGCSRNPRPAAASGLTRSMLDIHFGCFFGSVRAGRARRRTATKTSTTPIASFTARAAVEGELFGIRGLPPVTSTVTATIATSVSSHPRVNPRPLSNPRSAASSRIIAVSGIGSRVTTRPMRNKSRIMSSLPICRATTVAGAGRRRRSERPRGCPGTATCHTCGRRKELDGGPPGARVPVPTTRLRFPVRDRAVSVVGELQCRRPPSIARSCDGRPAAARANGPVGILRP